MNKLLAFILKIKSEILPVVSVAFLLFISLAVIAQTAAPNQNPKHSSPAEEASDYLQSIEKDPNVVPNTSAWYAQPWIWAIVASVLILIIGWIFTRYGKREPDSERGL